MNGSVGYSEHAGDSEPAVILPRHNIMVKVCGHRREGTGTYYTDHMFAIEVQCGTISYTVERTYVDFVELDLKLRKMFPRCSFDMLPLDAYEIVSKHLRKEEKQQSSGVDHRQSLILPERNGRMSSVARTVSVSALTGGAVGHTGGVYLLSSHSKEHFKEKLPSINLYMRQLLSQHEILVSDLFINFIADDATMGAPYVTEVDILLQDELAVNVTVRNIEEASFLVKPSQLVVWKFSTSNYDIGFSVEVNSETKLALTRYKSWEKPISGSIEIGMTGVCVLRWDNSYSKLHNKELQWMARVIDADEFNIARSEALDLYREHKRAADQKMVLFHAAVRHAASVSGVIHATSLHQVIQEEEYHRNYDLGERLKRVEYEKKIALDDLHSALSSIDALVDSKSAADRTTIDAKCQAKAAEERASAHEREKTDIKIANMEMANQLKGMSCEINDLQAELGRCTSTIETLNSELSVRNLDLSNPETKIVEEAATRLPIVEAELENIKRSYTSVCQQLVESKNNAAHMAYELVAAAERDDENRAHIEELQRQLIACRKQYSDGADVYNDAECDNDSLSSACDTSFNLSCDLKPLVHRMAKRKLQNGIWPITEEFTTHNC